MFLRIWNAYGIFINLEGIHFHNFATVYVDRMWGSEVGSIIASWCEVQDSESHSGLDEVILLQPKVYHHYGDWGLHQSTSLTA